MTDVEMAVVPEKATKVVTDPRIARKLIGNKYEIVDIKPKKNFPKETVFVFKVTGNFMSELEKLIEERNA